MVAPCFSFFCGTASRLLRISMIYNASCASVLSWSPIHLILVRSGSQQWTWPLLVQIKEEIYSYKPKSDVSWWRNDFPRMLCEIFSKGSKDKIRLHLESASCVRLANDRDGKKPSFVLPTFYIDEHFKAHRELFFQRAEVCRHGSCRTFYK